MPVYKLSYFNAKAKGELNRLILSTAGQDFEDDRLTNDTWPELKQSKRNFTYKYQSRLHLKGILSTSCVIFSYPKLLSISVLTFIK